jgi:hypothetical protein
MEEYGLTPDQLVAKDFRIIQSARQSSRPGYHPYGKRDWIIAVKKIRKTDGVLTAKHLQRNYPDLYHQGTWLFGNWDNGLDAAGLNPEKTRLRRSWGENKIIAAIRQMRSKELPLNAQYVMKNHPKLFSSAKRQFGPWSRALIAAGITKKRISGTVNKPLVLLRALGEALETRPTGEMPQALRF